MLSSVLMILKDKHVYMYILFVHFCLRDVKDDMYAHVYSYLIATKYRRVNMNLVYQKERKPLYFHLLFKE